MSGINSSVTRLSPMRSKITRVPWPVSPAQWPRSTAEFILTLPCDGPLLSDDYVARFIDSYRAREAPVQVAFDGERLQPVHAMIKVDLLPSLNQFLDSGDRKIDRWYAQHDYARVDFSDCANMFRNINTPADRDSLQTAS